MYKKQASSYKKKVPTSQKRRARNRLTQSERERLERALNSLTGGRRRINNGIEMIQDLLD